MKRVYELDVYKLAEELSDMVWQDFDRWNKKVQNTVGYQIIRSSDSIAANIAEGYGRYTPADRKKFYLYSRGSLEETKSWLRKLIRRKVLSESDATEYKAIVEKLGPKLRVNRNWCGKSSLFCQLFVVLQVVMPILNIDVFLPFIPLLNR
ncbi:MAG: four helix bundle protein [Thermodesulfobacteriota bacterium]|nr:four helix bundle protein [Thermodesulfobacteriota bacterium]